ncbi:Zinc finger protein-like 1, variant 2 [Dermatophagoides farinae]|uniref:Zinc finger protein-like 1, variant 2 n=1 Tax=Dermatophagoides farinae TaxID=6954 RepID=A0A922IFU1_DERFA|nr:Zinc finger protein-like 1, variant 2 [Dermatophagoides farinae]
MNVHFSGSLFHDSSILYSSSNNRSNIVVVDLASSYYNVIHDVIDREPISNDWTIFDVSVSFRQLKFKVAK